MGVVQRVVEKRHAFSLQQISFIRLPFKRSKNLAEAGGNKSYVQISAPGVKNHLEGWGWCSAL